jgi:hypothetical protein
MNLNARRKRFVAEQARCRMLMKAAVAVAEARKLAAVG